MVFFKKNILVNSYALGHDVYAFCDKENRLIINNEIFDTGIDGYNYDFLENKIIYIKNQSTLFNGIEIPGKSFIKGTYNRYNHTIIVSGEFFLDYPNWHSNYYLYDIIQNTNKLLVNFSKLIGVLNEKKHIFFSDTKTIKCYSILSESILWLFSLNPLGSYINLSNETLPYEVKCFIGTWNNLLIVQLKNATVLFLDIETGEQKHILHFKEHVMLPEAVGLNDAPKMQLAGDELYWLSNQSLFKVTLQNFKVYNIRNYFNEPRELQYRFFYNTVLNGKIYFTAEKGWQTVIPHHLGVMDAGTGEILWEYKPEKSHGLSEAPQFANGKLYMRTNSKELYVFEEDK